MNNKTKQISVKNTLQNSYNISTYNVFDLKVSVFENHNLLKYIKTSISDNKKIICYGYSFGTIPYFREYPEIALYSNTFDISVCDGRWFYLFCKIQSIPVKSDLSIPNMTEKILELANINKYSLMILGSTEENNKKASQNIRNKYPNINVLQGFDGGFFTDLDNKESCKKINENKPNILLIGVSSPKKEKFAYFFKDKISCNVIIPCGGYIDILSGKSKPMPKLIKKMGLAFLYRFLQEPKRLFRDSILNTLESLFILIPRTIFLKNFSFPKHYHNEMDFPIK